jgi:hypothetical protein
MSFLDAASLFAQSLPESSIWVLEALNEIDELKGGPSLTKDERRARATELYRALLAGLEPLREPTPPEHRQGSAAFRSWFSEAVLLWIRFARTGSAPTIDTVGADTLKDFPIDLPLDRAAAEAVRNALARAFEFSPEELAAVERRIEHLTSNLELKQKITHALASELQQGERLSGEGRGGSR